MDTARAAFTEAIARAPGHAMARAGLQLTGSRSPVETTDEDGSGSGAPDQPYAVDRAMARAALSIARGAVTEGANLVHAALTAAAPGNAAWLLPVDPLLDIRLNPAAWQPALALLHERTFVLAKV